MDDSLRQWMVDEDGSMVRTGEYFPRRRPNLGIYGGPFDPEPEENNLVYI